MARFPNSQLPGPLRADGSCAELMRAVRRSIAIVEDDSGMREALTRMLKAAGYEARGYCSAEALLDNGSSEPAGCLVLDVHLPGASGLELQRQLIDSGRARPVVFITAHDTAEARKAADALHAVAFLTKPFEGRLLLDAVKRALAQKAN
jgi:FixJ family two-component response regulator